MGFDGSAGHEQRLCDLRVGEPFGGHLGHAALLRGEGVEAGEDERAWPRSRGRELRAGSLDERHGARAVGQLHPAAERLAGVSTAVRT